MITIDFRRIEVEDGFRILDMGCGAGRHVGAIYERYRATVIGADRNHPDLMAAVKRLALHDGFATHKDVEVADMPLLTQFDRNEPVAVSRK